MSDVLVWATLLGGAAALFYFWDKLVAWIRPNLATPAQVEPSVKYVDTEYPLRSGLQADLESQGYRIRWSREEKLARRFGDGWDAVVEVAEDGSELFLKVRDPSGDLTLVMKKA